MVHPNGREKLIAGSEVELRWEGVDPEEQVRLEYSVDGGAHWALISQAATGLRHTWHVPRMPSERCLLRVFADIRPPVRDEMVLIPAGTFRMGDITGKGYPQELPVHDVTIAQPFLMCRTEITQGQYEQVTGRNPSRTLGRTLPVEFVSWYEAVEFCNELSRQEGLDPCYSGSGEDITCDFTANGYRLPTEAEWEYACRAGTETDFYSGNMQHRQFNPPDPALSRAGWYRGNSDSTIHPVAQKEANAFGLYDMHGNVDEWCWDWNDERYYVNSPSTDPRGPSTGSRRAQRGGCWYQWAVTCRSAGRSHYFPAERGYANPLDGTTHGFGFRVVKKYR